MCSRNVSGMPEERRPSTMQRICRRMGRESQNIPQMGVSNYLRARQPAPIIQNPPARYNEFFRENALTSSPTIGCHTHGICPGELNRTPPMLEVGEDETSTFDRDIRDEELNAKRGVYADMEHENDFRNIMGYTFQSPQYSPLPKMPKRLRRKTNQELFEECMMLAKFQAARRQILADVATLPGPSEFQAAGQSTPDGSPRRGPQQDPFEGMSPIRDSDDECPPCEQ